MTGRDESSPDGGGDVDETDEGLRDAMKRAEWPDGDPVFGVVRDGEARAYPLLEMRDAPVNDRVGDRPVVVGRVEATVPAGLPDHVAHRHDRDTGLAGDGGDLALPAAGQPDGSDDGHHASYSGAAVKRCDL